MALRVHPAVRFVEGSYALLVDGDTTAVDRLAGAREAFRAAGLTGDAHMATMMWAVAAAFMAPATPLRSPAICMSPRPRSPVPSGPGAGRPGVRGSPSCGTAIRRGPCPGCGTLWPGSGLSATLLGAAQGLRRDMGVDLTGLLPFHTAHLTAELRVREELGDEAYVMAHDAGFTAADRVALALDLTSTGRPDGLQGTLNSAPARPTRVRYGPACLLGDTGVRGGDHEGPAPATAGPLITSG
ncbi:hypothetical protein [Streptomyces sp. CA-179760]|uniref:hypothetical protein n=1 Tax=Streptomyces sp. CA-179760 TaxID=3240054 RepID=UPI003D8E25AD